MSKRMLVIGPSWVGDMVMAQSLFITLKNQQPDVLIDVLAPEWSLPILERMPEVNAGIVMPVGHGKLELKARRKIGHQLRNKYDQAFVLPNSLKSAFIPFFAKIKIRTGWLGELRFGWLNDWRKLNKEAYPLMVQRFNALAHTKNYSLPEAPSPSLTVDLENQKHLRETFSLTEEKIIALCPGAEFGPAKQWPKDRYAALAERYLQKGWQVILLGSAKDKVVCEKIIGLVNEGFQARCSNIAGETQLVDTVDLLAMADAVVSNDSGLMHIAAAVETPLAVVYGSTSPKFTPPLSTKVAIVRTGIECSPCFKRDCPLKHLKCLKELPAEKVFASLENVLDVS